MHIFQVEDAKHWKQTVQHNEFHLNSKSFNQLLLTFECLFLLSVSQAGIPIYHQGASASETILGCTCLDQAMAHQRGTHTNPTEPNGRAGGRKP